MDKEITWNYRVLKTVVSEDEVYYSIHEVYYQGDKIHSYSEYPIEPLGDTLAELLIDIDNIKKALDKPVLQEVNDKLVELAERNR